MKERPLSIPEKPDASAGILETQRHALLEELPVKVDQIIWKDLDFKIAIEKVRGIRANSERSGGKVYRHHRVCHASMSLADGLKFGESI